MIRRIWFRGGDLLVDAIVHLTLELLSNFANLRLIKAGNYMNKVKWILLLIVMTQTQMSFAGIYKWTDSNGKVHFSDKPQPNAKKLDIKQQTPTGTESSKDRLKRQKALANEYQDIREEKERKKRKLDASKNRLSAMCNRLKNKILTYEEVDYLFVRDKAGKKKRLSNQQKNQETKSLKKLYADKCS